MMRRGKLLNPVSMLVAGLFLGVAARLMDIYCPLFGEIFSQMAVWILLGTCRIVKHIVQRTRLEKASGEVSWGSYLNGEDGR